MAVSDLDSCNIRIYNKYLSVPPPFPSVHVVIHAYSVVLISIVLLRCIDKVGSKSRVAIQGLHVLKCVTVVDIEDLTSHEYFFAVKVGPT